MDSFKDKYFIGIPTSQDMGDRLLLICLIIQLYNALKMKKPGVTVYQVIAACVGPGNLTPDFTATLADVCEWFMQGCKKFPDMGIPLKEIPAKIKELIYDTLPF